MELHEIRKIARKLLDTTRVLAEGPNTYLSLFARVVEGTFRRDYLTLYTMVYLAEYDNPKTRTAFGTSCMDLCRRVLEDFISLEYMLLKGKEPLAKKFLAFTAIEEKRDMDYLEAAGVSIDPQLKKTRNDNYEKVKRQFLDTSNKAKRNAWRELTDFLKSKGKVNQQLEQQIEEEFNRRYPNTNQQPRKAWAGLDTEGMIVELLKGGVINDSQQQQLLQTYLMGNRKNHFSPSDIAVFLHSNLYSAVNDDDLVSSLVFTTISVTQMARIFADEFDISEDTKEAIEGIWQTLFIMVPKSWTGK